MRAEERGLSLFVHAKQALDHGLGMGLDCFQTMSPGEVHGKPSNPGGDRREQESAEQDQPILLENSGGQDKDDEARSGIGERDGH